MALNDRAKTLLLNALGLPEVRDQVAALLDEADSADGALQRSGGTMTGVLNMGSQKITDLGAPTADGDAANKLYIDTVDATKVSGPGSATDNAIVRFDATTGKLVQNSAVSIDDTSGQMTFLAASGANILLSTDGAGSWGSASANRPDSVNIKTSLNIGLTSPETSLAPLYISLEDSGLFPFVVDKRVSTSTRGTLALQRTARGTKAAPTALLANDYISFWGGRGYGTSQFSSATTVGIALEASENFTNTANGTRVTIEASPTGSTTRAGIFRINGSGEVTLLKSSGAHLRLSTDGAGDLGNPTDNRFDKAYFKTELNVAGIVMNNTGDGIRFPEEDTAYLQGGNTQTIGGTAGEVQIIGGTYVPASGAGSAGGIFLLAGVAQGGTASGGPCELYGGNADAGDGGRIYLNSGNSSSGAKGHIEFAIASSEIARFDVNGNLLLQTGNLSVELAGKGIDIKEGSNARMGVSVLVAGTVTVATTAVTANSRIYLTSQVDGGVPGFLRVSARNAGTDFTITSGNVADTSTVAWLIVEPA